MPPPGFELVIARQLSLSAWAVRGTPLDLLSLLATTMDLTSRTAANRSPSRGTMRSHFRNQRGSPESTGEQPAIFEGRAAGSFTCCETTIIKRLRELHCDRVLAGHNSCVLVVANATC